MPSSASTTKHPRVAIVGGGLGGLMLAAHLHRAGVPFTVFERDAQLNERAHIGGCLDMHKESGQRALDGAQIDWRKHIRPGGEETRIYSKNGELLYSHGGVAERASPPDDASAVHEDSRPEVDRTVLRQLIHDVVPADKIKWGHRFASATRLPSGVFQLSFTPDPSGLTPAPVEADLIVGADGAKSQVRTLLSQDTPFYAGITGAEVSLAPDVVASADADVQEAIKHVGGGSAASLHQGTALLAQVNATGRVRTYAWFNAPQPDAVDVSSPAAARADLLQRYSGWAPWMRTLITHCDDAAVYARPLYMLRVGHRWAHVRGVTALGDAAHMMSPFAGEGANLALLDALELAQAIASGEDWDAAVEKYEEEMFRRSKEKATVSKENQDRFLGPDAPGSVVEWFKQFAPPPEGECPREGH